MSLVIDRLARLDRVGELDDRQLLLPRLVHHRDDPLGDQLRQLGLGHGDLEQQVARLDVLNDVHHLEHDAGDLPVLAFDLAPRRAGTDRESCSGWRPRRRPGS